MKYYIIAGEASGDLHASNLMKALQKEDSNANFRFWGGDLMQNVGGTLVKHYKERAFMGFVEVIMNLSKIFKDISFCKKDIETFNEHYNLYEAYRDWGRSHLVRNFFILKERSLSMITDKASDRYLELISNRPEIFQKASLKHIASFLGITDSSLSRIRKEVLK